MDTGQLNASETREPRKRLVVLQSIGAWLANTMVWLFDQVTSLGPEIENHVVCEQQINLNEFFVPRIRCLSKEFPLRSKWGRMLRKTGLRGGLGIKRRVTCECEAQLIHSHFGNYGWGDLETAKATRTKHIVTFYGVDVNKLPTTDSRWLPRYRELFQSAQHFLCEGPFMADALVKMGCPREKITVHHLGVRIGQIHYRARVAERNRPLRVLLCASFVEKKGLPYALEALAEFGKDFPFEATLVGGDTRLAVHEAEKKRIFDTIERCNLAGKVNLRGFLPYAQVIEAAYEHDIFLSPSVTGTDGDTEGGAPVTIALMAATGMPIVSTTHCDIPEIVEHGVSALLAPERDSTSLAEHLRWFGQNPGQWESFGKAGRDRMEKEFDCEQQGLRLAGIYREVLAGQKSAVNDNVTH